eukprot:tig00001366_g8386.t1
MHFVASCAFSLPAAGRAVGGVPGRQIASRGAGPSTPAPAARPAERTSFFGDAARFDHDPSRRLVGRSRVRGCSQLQISSFDKTNKPGSNDSRSDRNNDTDRESNPGNFSHNLLTVIGEACSTERVVAVQALQSLYMFLEGEEDFTLLLEEWETLSVLLPLLAHRETEVASLATQIVELLCLQEPTRARLAAMGVIPQLLELLRRRDRRLLRGVLRILFNILPVRNQEYLEEVGDAVAQLVRAAEEEADPELHRLISGLTFAFSVDERNWKTLGAQGAIPALVRLLDSPSDEAREYSARALGALACCESNWVGILRTGGFEKLVGMLSEGRESLRESAATAIFAPSNAYDARVFEAAVAPLVAGLSSGSARLQSACASALWGLAGHPRLRQLIGEAGGVPGLARLARESALPKTVEYALRALTLLAQDERELQYELNLGAREVCMRRLADSEERVAWAAGRMLWNITAPHIQISGNSWNN